MILIISYVCLFVCQSVCNEIRCRKLLIKNLQKITHFKGLTNEITRNVIERQK